MEDEYIVGFYLDNKDYQFCVKFQNNHIYNLNTKLITSCSIIELPGKKVYSGASLKNPKDISNVWEGRRWALKRAVFHLWMIWTDLKKTSISWNPFWQLFRQSLAKNKNYLSDRKEHKYG